MPPAGIPAGELGSPGPGCTYLDWDCQGGHLPRKERFAGTWGFKGQNQGIAGQPGGGGVGWVPRNRGSWEPAPWGKFLDELRLGCSE